MGKTNPPPPAESLPDPDDVLRVMLNTPPQPHGASAKARKTGKAAKPKPAKASAKKT